MLYLGYVGFTVPFAFAIAALVTGRVGEGWLVETRRWTLFAWGFLTVGIVLGAWWCYEVLGWGGYWALGPGRERLVPAVAHRHRLPPLGDGPGAPGDAAGLEPVAAVRHVLRSPSSGTFLTRSGVLDSVHAFTESADRAAAARLLRAHRGRHRRAHRLAGRPAAVARAHRLAGLPRGRVPRQQRAVRRASRSSCCSAPCSRWSSRRSTATSSRWARPYFDRMTMPIGLALLFLMAVAPVLPWRKASGELLSPAAALAGVGGHGRGRGRGRARRPGPRPAAGLRARRVRRPARPCRQVVLATRRQGWRGLVGRTNGGMIVHLGVVLIAVALAAVRQLRPRARGRPGGRRDGARRRPHVTYVGHRRSSSEQDVGAGPGQRRRRRSTSPRINRFPGTEQAIGTPSVRDQPERGRVPGADRAPEGDERPTIGLRVIVQPLVLWLWIGGAGHGRRHRPRRVPRPPPRPDRPGVRPVGAPASSTAPAGRAAGRARGRRRAGRERWRSGRDRRRRAPRRRRAGRRAASPRPHRPIVSVVVALLAVAFVVVLATREPASEQAGDSPLVGKAAPALAGETIDGGTFDLDAQRGRWVVVNFFATWCAPCRVEHPELAASTRSTGRRRRGVVSVVYHDTETAIRTSSPRRAATGRSARTRTGRPRSRTAWSRCPSRTWSTRTAGSWPSSSAASPRRASTALADIEAAADAAAVDQ